MSPAGVFGRPSPTSRPRRLGPVEGAASRTAVRRPAGESLEIVTAIRGRAALDGDGWRETIAPYETLVIPASVAEYRIEGPAGGLVAIGTVP